MRARKPTGSPSRWNKRALGCQGPAQPSPTLGDALNAGYGYLEVKCLGQCSEVRRYPYKRSHLVVGLRPNKFSADDQASTWWPGER